MVRSRQGSIQRPGATLMPVVVTSVVFGLPVYFIGFMLSYTLGSPGDPAWGNHLAFLILIAIFGTVCGLSVLLASLWEPTVTIGGLFAFGIWSAWSLNAFVIALGSAVSATQKHHGSVSRNFSTTTDVLVTAGLVVAAAFCARKARRLTDVH